MGKQSDEEARRQLDEDDRARQDKAHGPAWKSGQTIGKAKDSGKK